MCLMHLIGSAIAQHIVRIQSCQPIPPQHLNIHYKPRKFFPDSFNILFFFIYSVVIIWLTLAKWCFKPLCWMTLWTSYYTPAVEKENLSVISSPEACHRERLISCMGLRVSKLIYRPTDGLRRNGGVAERGECHTESELREYNLDLLLTQQSQGESHPRKGNRLRTRDWTRLLRQSLQRSLHAQ